MALTDKLTAIADAIRAKTGGTTPLTLAQMPTEIAAIQAGGGGIGAVKFVDVDITVEPSTTTAVAYAVDELELLSSTENPEKASSAFSTEDAYIVMITPKEITGEQVGTSPSIYRSTFAVLYGVNSYAGATANVISYGTAGVAAQTQGIYVSRLSCTSIADGKKIGRLLLNVRNNAAGAYEVLAGIYNVQIWYLTDWKWRFTS